MDVFFSIIIPTYNRSEKIKRLLNSLVNQSYKNFEVIICDDGSTDNTEAIVDSYKNKLNIQYVWDNNWGGPARPRNKGVLKSKGEWICFIDSDDYWYKNKLISLLPHLPKYDLIYHQLSVYNETKGRNTIKTIGKDTGDDPFKNLIYFGNTIPNSSVTVKKEVLVKVGLFSENRELIAFEDYDLWLRIAREGYRFKFLKNKLGGYSWDNKSNISSISNKRIATEKKIFFEIVNHLSAKDKIQALCMFNYKMGLYHGNIGEYYDAIKYLKLAQQSKFVSYRLKSLMFHIYFKLKL